MSAATRYQTILAEQRRQIGYLAKDLGLLRDPADLADHTANEMRAMLLTLLVSTVDLENYQPAAEVQS